MITEVQALFWDIIEGILSPVDSGEKRGLVVDYWSAKSHAYAVSAPRKLVEEARRYFCSQPMRTR